MQSPGQEIPGGELVTEPPPTTDTVRVCTVTKTAVTEWPWSMVRLHTPVPEQSPLQPAKAKPATGVAVRVTAVPSP